MQAIARKFDVAGRDERNRSLGKAGEERVLQHERAILSGAGGQDLAKKVRWISQEEGDGAGYDISSFTPDGNSRLIEVKTTNGWERTPFHISETSWRSQSKTVTAGSCSGYGISLGNQERSNCVHLWMHMSH